MDKAKIILIGVATVIVIFILRKYIKDVKVRNTEIKIENVTDDAVKNKGLNSLTYGYLKGQKITEISPSSKEVKNICEYFKNTFSGKIYRVEKLALLNVAKKIKSKRILSQVNKYYFTLYNIDIYSDMQNLLSMTIKKMSGGEEAYIELLKYFNSLKPS